MGEEGVGGELGELAAPQVRSQDLEPMRGSEPMPMRT